MNIWKHFLKNNTARGIGLTDPSHPARVWIDEASKIADNVITFSLAGNSTLTKINGSEATHLVSAIDKALEKSPDDINLLLAKSGALCCASQFATAEDVIDQVLSINQEHFEARMRKDNWEKWNHLFIYKPWSLTATTLQPGMAARLNAPHKIQTVRDGLQISIAVVVPVQTQEFPDGLSSGMRSKWEPMLSDTPHGTIVAHYLLVEDNPSSPYKSEGFLPTFFPNEVNPSSGYWLLQRMSNINSCFLVLTDGHKVLYNNRYVFPAALRSTLCSISQKISKKTAKEDLTAFQKAIEWYQEHIDIKSVPIHF